MAPTHTFGLLTLAGGRVEHAEILAC
jgi:hypothetical protein